MKRRGPGRPMLSKSERKGAIFSVRLSPKEREQVESAAQALGMKAAAWARLALMHACLKDGRLEQ